MRNLLILLTICFSASGQFYQDRNSISPENRIVTIGNAIIYLPADRAVVTVKLITEDTSSVENAFYKHKKRVDKMSELLLEAKLKKGSITYTLINAGVRYRRNDREETKSIFSTSQDFMIEIDDIQNYTSFVVKLISNGFGTFSTAWKSSLETEFQDKLIKNAIEAARKKAITMATTANRSLGKILKVTDTTDADPNFATEESFNYTLNEEISVEVGTDGLFRQFPQSIQKTMKVKVVFSLK